MRCYFTGEECDCGGDMETECPHDEMVVDDIPGMGEFDHDHVDFEESLNVEARMADMSERLDQCRASRR